MADPYLETRIKHITDEDLFGSLKLGDRKLAAVRKAASNGDAQGAAQAWHAYLKRRLRKGAPSASAEPACSATTISR